MHKNHINVNKTTENLKKKTTDSRINGCGHNRQNTYAA